MEVKFIGESGTYKTVDGAEITIETGSVFKCMEKEYHSGLFVRITDPSGVHIKVKREDLQKV